MTIKGKVMTGKYQNDGATVMHKFPSSSNISSRGKEYGIEQGLCASLTVNDGEQTKILMCAIFRTGRKEWLIATNVPGRKNLVTITMVIIDELSVMVSLVIAFML